MASDPGGLAWQASNCMTIVSWQVGSPKQNHLQPQMLWKYIWNNQNNRWLIAARKQLGSNPGVWAKDKRLESFLEFGCSLGSAIGQVFPKTETGPKME